MNFVVTLLSSVISVALAQGWEEQLALLSLRLAKLQAKASELSDAYKIHI
jgi:hypothetical protein